ncbi:2-phosphosulfolactate phosphatase [Microbacterium flavum]|uniref:2-phosphosulfolactate phosphatase n=1 Tax=Microbacterium flavum TaxID=415216 RepID=UPI0024ACC870|nr:2-phosphosulfolactate phosphatase [Microbacterium flavum]
MSSPFDQSRYQVRLAWGASGLDMLAPADVVIVVDVLRLSTTVAARLDAGEDVPLDAAAHATSLNGAAVAAHAAQLAHRPVVLLGGLRNASAAARAALAEQTRRGARTSIAVIPAGELAGRRPGAPLRFAVEDLLGAGAVVDALGALGIDHTAPDAAAAAEAFRGLRGATRHLLTASGSGQELVERGARDEVLAAAEVDASASVPVLRGDVFRPYAD